MYVPHCLSQGRYAGAFRRPFSVLIGFTGRDILYDNCSGCRGASENVPERLSVLQNGLCRKRAGGGKIALCQKWQYGVEIRVALCSQSERPEHFSALVQKASAEHVNAYAYGMMNAHHERESYSLRGRCRFSSTPAASMQLAGGGILKGCGPYEQKKGLPLTPGAQRSQTGGPILPACESDKSRHRIHKQSEISSAQQPR